MGEGWGGRGQGDENSVFNTCFLIYCSLLSGVFVLKISKKNGQVLNKPQTRLLLKKILEVPFYKSRQTYIYIYIYIVVSVSLGSSLE